MQNLMAHPHPNDHLTEHLTPLENIKLDAVCTCGCNAFFYSEMDPDGYFCMECGKPDPITQQTLDTEEPGYWGL